MNLTDLLLYMEINQHECIAVMVAINKYNNFVTIQVFCDGDIIHNSYKNNNLNEYDNIEGTHFLKENKKTFMNKLNSSLIESMYDTDNYMYIEKNNSIIQFHKDPVNFIKKHIYQETHLIENLKFIEKL